MSLIRPFQEGDYPAVVALRNAVEPEPIDEQSLRDRDQQNRTDPSAKWQRFVIEDETGQVVGFTSVGYGSWLPPGQFAIALLVDAPHRGRGFGQQLLTAAEEWALAEGAEELTCMIRGEDEHSYQWVTRRGWVMDLQRTESVLDLKGWESTRFTDKIERVRQSGITLLCLSELSEELLRGLYDVEALTAPDVPDYEGHMPTFEEWRRIFEGFTQEKAIAIALAEDRVVGASALLLPRLPGAGGLTFYTGVLREYRGRGIALALKLLTIEAAVATGVPHLRTNNDEENPAMLAVNERLGYQMLPGPRRMKKGLARA